MLECIQLENFRRFDNHLVRFRPTTIIVGANNAGKSTIVEAIRLVSLVANRHGRLNFGPPPDWVTDPTAGIGVSPSLRDLNTNLSTVVNAAGEPPARIRATFSKGETVDIFVNDDDRVFASVWTSRGHLISSKSQATTNPLPRVAVQPQITPLVLHEKVLDDRTVRRGLDSPLASQHFRNQIRFLYEPHFLDFCKLSEDTWPTLQIRELLDGHGDIDELQLLVRDRAFVGEVGNMGHGLQMWLQIMWFLTRNSSAPTIVLDEPDVYMHPDLQRRLIQRLRGGTSQLLVATHSVEIMAEVEPTDVLVIDSDLPESPWASDVAGVQGAIDLMGGVHNLDLARLVSARRFLIVEGDDIDLLRRPYTRLFPDADALDALPKLAVAGWTGWQRAIGAAAALRQSSGDRITSYCIFDSDFHHPAEICKRYQDASGASIHLHIWKRKELENYLLVPEAIQRTIVAKASAGRGVPDVETIEGALRLAAEELHPTVIDNYAETYRLCYRRSSVPEASRWARKYLQARLDLGMDLGSLVSGKRLISKMSSWATAKYGASFGPPELALSLRDTEVPAELAAVLRAVHLSEPIPEVHRQHWYDVPPEFHLQPDDGG